MRIEYDEECDPFNYERIVKFHGRDAIARVVKLALGRISDQIHALLVDADPFVIPIHGSLWIEIKLGITTKDTDN